MSLDLARGPDFSRACQKGPLGTKLCDLVLDQIHRLRHATERPVSSVCERNINVGHLFVRG